MSMTLPVPGADFGTWGTQLNDWLGVGHNPDGTLKGAFLEPVNNLSDVLSPEAARINIGAASQLPGIFYVDDYGADPTGTNDSTTAFQDAVDAATAAGPLTPYILVLSVTALGAGYHLTDLPQFFRNQGMMGMGSSLSQITWLGSGACIVQNDTNAAMTATATNGTTTLTFASVPSTVIVGQTVHGAGTTGAQTITAINYITGVVTVTNSGATNALTTSAYQFSNWNTYSSVGGSMSGFRVNTAAGAGKIGLTFGDLLGMNNMDLEFNGFVGVGSIGYYGNNVAGWSEHGQHQVRCLNCTDAVIWDTGSFDYSTWDIYVNVFNGFTNSQQTITNVALTTNVATITAANSYVVGQVVIVAGLTTTALNGTWTVTAASSSTYSFNFTHANITSVADSGTSTASAFNCLSARNGVQAIGMSVTMKVNAGTGVNNVGWLIGWDAGGGGVGTSTFQGTIDIHAETDAGTGTGHIPIKMNGGASCQFNAIGAFEGLAPSVKWGASVFVGSNQAASTSFGFTGRLNFDEVTPQLGKMQTGDGIVTWGTTTKREVVGTSPFGGALFINAGDVVHVYPTASSINLTVSAGAGTSTVNYKSWDLYFHCGRTGGTAIVWTGMPGGTPLSAGGSLPVLSTTIGLIDHLRFIWSPTLGKYEVIAIAIGLA